MEAPNRVRTPGIEQGTGQLSEIERLAQSFRRSLLAANKAKATVTAYMRPVLSFAAFVEAQGMPRALHSIKREHVEAYMVSLREREGIRNGRTTGQPLSPSYLLKQYKGLKVYFDWATEEGEIKRSPMANMHPPRVPDKPVPVLTDDELRRLLRTCDGRDFYSRRDQAILRLLIDTGARLSEIGELRVADIDFDNSLAHVVGKGGRPRSCPFGRKSAQALDRYLRTRDNYSEAAKGPSLWLGKHGAMGKWGVAQVVKRRAKQAGLETRVHTHMFRHTMAHRWLAGDGQEGSLMRLAGWKSRTMLSRYGASMADERARDEHRRMGLGDKL